MTEHKLHPPGNELDDEMEFNGPADTVCGTDIGRGWKQVVDHCLRNPELYIDIMSLGTIKHKAVDAYTIAALDFIVNAARDYLNTTARDIVLHAGRDIVIDSEASTEIHSGDQLTVLSDQQITIDSESTYIRNLTLEGIGGKLLAASIADMSAAIADNASSIADLSATVENIAARLSSLETEVGNIVIPDIAPLTNRVAALEAAIDGLESGGSSSGGDNGGGSTSPTVATPSVISPSKGATNVSTPLFVAASPYSYSGDPYEKVSKTVWKLSTDPDFSSNLKTVTTYSWSPDPSGTYDPESVTETIHGLSPNTKYYIMVQYHSLAGEVSEWSSPTHYFTTAP